MILQEETDTIALFVKGVVLTNTGNECFEKASYEDAISEFIKVMKTNKQSYKYFCERGMYFAQLGSDQSTINNFLQYYQTITQSDLALYLRGMANYYMSNALDAINDFTQVLQRCPQFKFCFNDRGNAYSSVKLLEEAIQDYSKAIELDKQYAVAYNNRGVLLYDLGRKEEAFIDYAKSIEINPQDADSYFNRGNLLYDLGRKEEALIDYSQAIFINPQFDVAYYNRANTLNDLGRKQDSLIDFSNAIEINSQYADAYHNKGNVLKDLGRKEEAVANYSKVIEINQQDAKAYFIRGNLQDDLGRKEKALIDYSQAIEINPLYANAYFNRGSLLDNLGRKEEALIDFSKVIDINPHDADAYYNRGNVLKDLERNEESYHDYIKALEIHPDDPLINVQLGIFFLNNQETEKGREYMIKAQQLLESLTQLDKQKYQLQEGNINYIKLKVKIIQEMDQQISQVKLMIKSLNDDQQKQIMQEIQPIEAMFRQQINLSILKDSKNGNNQILSLAYQEMLLLKQKVSQLENQRSYLINKEMDQLKKDEKRYTYYLSLYWRIYNYISACQQLSTELFMKNTQAVIDSNNEKVALVATKVVTQISNIAGSIPIAGSVIKIISSALEFSFSKYLDYKFNQIVIKLTQIVQVRCDSKRDFNEEIQFAIIQQSKKLPEDLGEEEEQNLVEYIKQIYQKDRECGNKRAQDPYWIKGIADTLKILQNLLLNFQFIQEDDKKKLHTVILEQFQADNMQVKKEKGKQSWRTNCCQIQ